MRLVTLVAENRWRLLVLVSVCVFTLRGGCGRGALGFVFPGPALRWNTFCHQRLHGEWRWGNECKKSYSCSCSLDSRLDNSGTISIRKSVYGATTGRKRKGYTPGLSAFILPYDHISDGELYTAKNSFHLFGTKHGRIRQMGRQAREAWWWVRRRGVSTASAIVLMIAVIFSSPAQSRAGLFEFLEGDIYVNSPHRLAVRIPGDVSCYFSCLHIVHRFNAQQRVTDPMSACYRYQRSQTILDLSFRSLRPTMEEFFLILMTTKQGSL